MAGFTIAHIVVIGMFCGTLSRSVTDEEIMLLSVALPELIDADKALNDVNKNLIELNNEIENKTWDPSPGSSRQKLITIHLRDEMERQKQAYKRLIEAQEFRVSSESRFHSPNESVNLLRMANWKFNLESAAMSEYKARVTVILRNIDVATWHKQLIIEKLRSSNDGGETNYTRFLEEKGLEIIQLGYDLHIMEEEWRKMVAAVAETQRDIALIRKHHVPPKYRVALRLMDPIDHGKLVVPKALTQSTKQSMFERLQRLRNALGYADKRYTVPWISENKVQFYIPDDIQKELFTTYLFFCPSILKNSSFVRSESKNQVAYKG